MINIPYEKLIEIIKKESGLSDEEIEEKIKAKLDQLSGLISKEGAAHILANELKIKLNSAVQGKKAIADIIPGMRNLEIDAKVLNIYDVREFQVGQRSGKVGSIHVADETGSIRIVLWASKTDILNDLKQSDIIKVKQAYSKNNNNITEVHLNDNSEIIINPEGIKIDDVKVHKGSVGGRKNISELSEQDRNVELLGVIVQAFEPKFFETCPECRRKPKLVDGDYVCETHGKVTPLDSYLCNIILDDGTGTIRIVSFREVALKVLNRSEEEVLKIKDSPENFEPIKNEMIGSQVLVSGRVRKNQMFDRIEMIASDLEVPDPKKELERMK